METGAFKSHNATRCASHGNETDREKRSIDIGGWCRSHRFDAAKCHVCQSAISWLKNISFVQWQCALWMPKWIAIDVFCCGRKMIYPRENEPHKEADYYEIGLVRSESAQSHHIDATLYTIANQDSIQFTLARRGDAQSCMIHNKRSHYYRISLKTSNARARRLSKLCCSTHISLLFGDRAFYWIIQPHTAEVRMCVQHSECEHREKIIPYEKRLNVRNYSLDICAARLGEPFKKGATSRTQAQQYRKELAAEPWPTKIHHIFPLAHRTVRRSFIEF